MSSGRVLRSNTTEVVLMALGVISRARLHTVVVWAGRPQEARRRQQPRQARLRGDGDGDALITSTCAHKRDTSKYSQVKKLEGSALQIVKFEEK